MVELDSTRKGSVPKQKKIQKLIGIQGINHSEPTYLDLNLVAKIVKKFKNPKKIKIMILIKVK